MSKIIGFAVLLIVAITVMAWTRATGPEPQPPQTSGISPHEMHLKTNADALPVFKIDDQSMVLLAP